MRSAFDQRLRNAAHQRALHRTVAPRAGDEQVDDAIARVGDRLAGDAVQQQRAGFTPGGAATAASLSIS